MIKSNVLNSVETTFLTGLYHNLYGCPSQMIPLSRIAFHKLSKFGWYLNYLKGLSQDTDPRNPPG